jgi:hypothetical protein
VRRATRRRCPTSSRCSPDSGKPRPRSEWRAALAKLEPEPPFANFNRGMAALRAGDLVAAKESFKREIARAPDYHEFHFWLAIAHLGLGESDERASVTSVAMTQQHHARRPRPLRREARPPQRRALNARF